MMKSELAEKKVVWLKVKPLRRGRPPKTAAQRRDEAKFMKKYGMSEKELNVTLKSKTACERDIRQSANRSRYYLANRA